MTTQSTTAMTHSAVLAAGGCVPLSTLAAQANLETDTLVARTFLHPALAARPVVQLVPRLQLPGVEAELETLGFTATGDAVAVGAVRRRALGFPGWALVHDPKRAKYALDILRQFKKAAARAATKPGHARDEFNAIADKLGREVPHFLPSFWEEAARAFLATGSQAMAASAFDKARQAEAHHALKVDERERSAAFLEFALSGAIAVKSLAAHAKDLERQHGAAVAYPLYRDLCVRAVRGGVPPWAAMAADLRKLAKGAGVATDAADRELVRALVGASSLGRAPAEFWKATRKAWVAEGRADEAVRNALLTSWPQILEDDDEFMAQWLPLLSDAGCLDQMAGPRSRDHEPLGGPAGWLSRLLQKTDDPPTAVFGWLRKLAPRLRGDGVALRFEDEEAWHTDYPVDLLDLALELGVPVADPSEDGSLDLRSWAAGKSEDGEDRPRNPAYVVADPRFGPLVPAAVARAFDDDDFVQVAPGMAALTESRRAYLLDKTRDVAQGFYPTIAAAVESLQEDVPEATLREFPEAMAQLKAVDLAPRLAAQLRAGVFDEWAWPAWDSALRELGGDDPDDVTRSGVWPYLVLHDTKQAIVLGPEGEHFRHAFRLPTKARLRRTLFADGQLLVVFRDKDYDTKAYWSGKPNEIFDFSDEYELPRGEGAGALMPDGSLCLGARGVHAGDTKVASNLPVFADSTGAWRPFDQDDDEDGDGNPKPPDGLPRLQELNLATGDLGRRSWPNAIAPFAEAGWVVQVDASTLLPAPAGMQGSPLGLRDGLVGCFVRCAADQDDNGDTKRYHLRRIDGAQWMGDADDTPVGLLPVHSADRWHYLVENGHTGNLHAAESGELLENLDDVAPLPGAWTRIPPRACWHYLAPRDERGSDKLRAIDDGTARRWLELADVNEVAGKPGEALLSAVAVHLGAHSPLVLGVAHWALRFAVLAADLRKVTDGQPAEQGDDTQDLLSPRVDDGEAVQAFGKVAHDSRYASEDLTQQLGAVVRLLAGPDEQPPRACAQSDLAWFAWLGHLRALAFRLTGVYADDEARGHGVRFFEALLQTPLVDDLCLRVCTITIKDANLPWLLRDGDDDDISFANAWTFGLAGHRYLVRHDNWWDEDEGIELQLIELRGAHDWLLPPGATFEGDGDVAVHTAGGERAWLQQFLALLVEKGAPNWDPAVPAALAERADMAPAVAALLWAGMPRFNEYAHDFLGKTLREQIGVKLQEAAKAKEALGREDDDALRVLYGAAASGEAAQLWAPLLGAPSPVDRMATAWKASHTAHDAALADLLGLVEAALPDLNDAEGTLTALLNATTSPVLTTDAQWSLDRDGDPVTKAEGATFDADLLVDFARLLACLATQLPAGHAARKALPLALAKVRERLRNPDLLLPIGRWDTESPKDAKALKALVKSLGGTPYALPKGDDDDEPVQAFDTGRLVYLVGDEYVDFAFRPAHMQTLPADDLLFKLAEHCYCATDYVPAALAFVLSDEAAALAERAATTPVADGGWEMDPRVSATDLVQAVAGKLGLQRDAAALYLQLLTLAEPTTKNLQTWNGQTAAQLKPLLQALRDKQLVLQAKRPRAGREDFLPGGWDARKAPDLPLETWKTPLYWTGEAPPLGRVLALRPLHVLFEVAWARVLAGDGPRYG